MSLADKIFIDNCKTILDYGTSTEGQKNRPHWEDGSSAYTLKTFGLVNTYDLRKEFPAITLRRTAIKSAMDEVLWIYQKKSNNVNNLNSHIWDDWADGNGSIGKAYGYQVSHRKVTRKKEYDSQYILSHKHEFSENAITSIEPELNMCKLLHEGNIKTTFNIDIMMDQIDAVLYDLKNDPFSRRIMISLWDVDELDEMNLQPCCWAVNFVVTKEKECDDMVLNMLLHQRSGDMLVANNWNVVQYALLQMMIAQCVSMIPGKMIHTIADAHIYDRHIPMVEELIERKRYPAPIVKLNPYIKNFYDFTIKDIEIMDYRYNDFLHTISVAV